MISRGFTKRAADYSAPNCARILDRNWFLCLESRDSTPFSPIPLRELYLPGLSATDSSVGSRRGLVVDAINGPPKSELWFTRVLSPRMVLKPGKPRPLSWGGTNERVDSATGGRISVESLSGISIWIPWSSCSLTSYRFKPVFCYRVIPDYSSLSSP